jgi:sugar phosphate isomerase/epimerase
MDMKIGSSTIYALLSKHPLEAVGELQRNGIGTIELVWEYKHYHHLEKQARELKGTGADFSLHLPYFGAAFAHPDAEVRRFHAERARKAIGFAERTQATPCVLHGGIFQDWYLKSDSPLRMEDFYDAFAEEFQGLVSKAGKSGIKVVLENTCYGNLGSQYEHIQEMRGRVPGLGFCLDVPHAVQSGKTELLDRFIRDMDIYHVHVSDSFHLKDDHLPVGKGTLPIKETLQNLERKGYKGKVIFEGLTFQDTMESVKRLREMVG